MTQHQWETIERSIAGLSPKDKLELVERIMHSVRTELDVTPAEDPDVDKQVASPHKPIWEVIQEITASIPAEEWDKMPVDGAEQHDHYIYGTPKRPPS